jgi:hypothetical protein
MCAAASEALAFMPGFSVLAIVEEATIYGERRGEDYATAEVRQT